MAASSRGPTWLGPALPQGRAPSKAQVPVVGAGCGQHLWNGVQGTASWELQIKPLCFVCSRFGVTENKKEIEKMDPITLKQLPQSFLGEGKPRYHLGPWTKERGAQLQTRPAQSWASRPRALSMKANVTSRGSGVPRRTCRSANV